MSATEVLLNLLATALLRCTSDVGGTSPKRERRAGHLSVAGPSLALRARFLCPPLFLTINRHGAWPGARPGGFGSIGSAPSARHRPGRPRHRQTERNAFPDQTVRKKGSGVFFLDAQRAHILALREKRLPTPFSSGGPRTPLAIRAREAINRRISLGGLPAPTTSAASCRACRAPSSNVGCRPRRRRTSSESR